MTCLLRPRTFGVGWCGQLDEFSLPIQIVWLSGEDWCDGLSSKQEAVLYLAKSAEAVQCGGFAG